MSAIGNVFLFLVPLALIAMLGVVGFAFVRGIVKKDVPVAKAEAPAGAAAAPAPAASGDAAAAPAPAAGGGADADVMALGKTSYALCAACHGPDGKGFQAGPALMAPSLVGSELLLDANPDKALLVVLKGIAKENMNFMGVMAPLAAGLDDEKLAAVLTYVRNEWGNNAAPVTTEQAAAARAKFSALDAPAGIKRTEIDAVVEAHK
ncbi:MAG TPA: cytochrome c [Bacteroidia bacterium]|nr:cytochrome c [Bacteroidia bacterium]